MIIHKSRIRSLRSNLPFLGEGGRFVPAIQLDDVPNAKRRRIGFSAEPKEGETVLPAAIGPVSAYNAEGKYIVHKGRPMETASRMIEWQWTEYHGPYEVERSGIRDVPYKRYPREFINPPSLELTVAQTRRGQTYIVGPAVTLEAEDTAAVHAVNLFLELFGECEILTSALDTILSGQLRRVNWHILPPGKHPWEQLKKYLDPIIDRAPQGNQPVIRYRFNAMNSYNPTFHAVGCGGFHGYVVFGFPTKDLYVLESAYTGNATYVFRSNWEALSQLSKAQVLQAALHEARLIHNRGWLDQLKRLMR